MCGIVGILDGSGDNPPRVALLKRMLGMIRHRGPDEYGLYVDSSAGIGCARLSVVDLETGQQPIGNETGSLWIVFNGEIYNHPELRAELERAGHRFSTRSDTEVILHLYEDMGPASLRRLNGQFAIAIWDAGTRELFLARDRLGIRPLFYTRLPGSRGLIFASEIKALLLHPRVQPRFDAPALAQALTFWAALPPRTVFRDFWELPPGHYMRVRLDGGGVKTSVQRYWGLTFPESGREARMPEEEAQERLRDLLSDATRLRLRADVEVGSYLSGGLDSTVITALIGQHAPQSLRTFSIAFQDAAFDERIYQEIATDFLRTNHRRAECANADLGRVFPEVVWHAEVPVLRTSPAPMYLLSRLVHESGIKVVMTGEGADEFLGGYNIFKEDKIRRFWARQPHSSLRPLLLRRLYPYVADLSRSGDYLTAFYRGSLTEPHAPGYSHRVRWRNTQRLQRLFSSDMRGALEGYEPAHELLASLDGVLSTWSPLAQAQYLEVATFMAPYLLSSQGDRMMAAHSVEGRFPFLDHRVVAFCSQLPPSFKLRGLEEKHILKQSARCLVPPEIRRREKQPYRAPIRPAFFGHNLDYVDDLLSPGAIRASGVFDADTVTRLVGKCRGGPRMGEGDAMALVGVLSTQLLHHLFIDGFPVRRAADIRPLRILRRHGGRVPSSGEPALDITEELGL